MSVPNLVQPAYKTCHFDDIVSFRPGVWNGKPHGPDFLKTIVLNFRRYSSGANPYYRPYVSKFHDDKEAKGYVSGAKLGSDPDGTLALLLDADEVPEEFGALRAAGALQQPSIEYFQPVYDESGKLVDGFRLPDGSIEPTPVLKALTLLGAQSPGSKGLPRLPYAEHYDDADPKDRLRRRYGRSFLSFSNDSPFTTFSEGGTMDRAAMIAALQAMGMDTAWITDAIPDEGVKSILEFAQKMQQNPAATPPPDTSAMPMQMADLTGAGNIAPLPAPNPSPVPGVPNATPSKVTLQFADSKTSAATIAQHTAQYNQILANQAAIERQQQQQLAQMKFADVTAFVTQLGTPDGQGRVRIQPVQRTFYIRSLMKCDNVRVRTFEDKKTQGTELAEAKAELLSGLPFLRVSGERLPDPQSPVPGVNPGTGVDPERRLRMLRATPQGRGILAAKGDK